MSEPYPSLRLADIRKGKRYRTDLGDIDALAASIKVNGLLHPVVVTSDNLLVAGERRLAAVSLLGWTRVPVRIIDPVDLLTAERDENAVRKDFTPTEAVAIAAAIRPVEQELARERQGRPGQARSETVSERSPMALGESRERVAAAVGMSFTTLQRAEEVVEAANAGLIPQSVVEEMDETGVVAPAYRQAQAARGRAPRVERRAIAKPKRMPPRWRPLFTKWCRRAVREDRRWLVEMRQEIDAALAAIDGSSPEEDVTDGGRDPDA